jgi:galactokinase
VITENDRVLQAAHALEQGDFQFLGKLLYASHTSLRDNYQVSCPEIDFLVDQTKELDFVLGSRMMGGGFGGCTINLVDQAKSDDFVKYMRSKYRDRFDLDIASYCISIEDGTTRIS